MRLAPPHEAQPGTGGHSHDMSHTTAIPAGHSISADEPRWVTRVRHLTFVWALAYGALRLWWVTTGSRPAVPPLGDDLIILAGGGSVVLCLAAAVLALALGRAWRIPALRWAQWAASVTVTVLLAAASSLAVLDLVGALFPGVEFPFDAGATLSRAAGFACAVLLGTSTVLTRRVQRGACPACGHRARADTGRSTHIRTSAAHAPSWAVAAAYVAVVACLIRIGAQVVVGFDVDAMSSSPRSDVAARVGPMMFLTCIIASGTALPLALVHRWGRIFPRWMPVLSGRTVPRSLLLAPAFLVSAGLVTYFGAGVVLLVNEAIRGASAATAGTLPPWFFWVAVPAYIVWGVGLGTAAWSYFDRTRAACRRCGWGGPR
jgi:hypothetical protein